MQVVRERHRRFWQPLQKGEGGYFAVTAPLPGVAPLRAPKDLKEQWLSPEYAVERALHRSQSTYFGADAANVSFVNLGAGCFSAMLGGPYQLMPNTVWFDLAPPITSYDPPPRPVFQENAISRAVEGITKALCRASGGDFAVTVTDIGGQMDIEFSLRGEELLLDLLDEPEEVEALSKHINALWIDYYHKNVAMIDPACGYSSWIPVLHDKPFAPLQCDMSVMISPKQFERFVLPGLDQVGRAVDTAIYHLDGPGEYVHLDMILSLPNVHAIQWVPLPQTTIHDPNYYFQDFADEMSLSIYRKTLAAGKKMILTSCSPHQVGKIFDEVGCDGMFIMTECPTLDEAKQMEEAAKKWIR